MREAGTEERSRRHNQDCGINQESKIQGEE